MGIYKINFKPLILYKYYVKFEIYRKKCNYLSNNTEQIPFKVEGREIFTPYTRL
jgi:hypothetical protein